MGASVEAADRFPGDQSAFRVEEPKEATRKIQSYADNFK